MRAHTFLIALACSGCFSPVRDAADLPYPAHWPAKQPLASCDSLVGEYEYFGLTYPERANAPELIEPMFLRRTGPGSFPETASIHVRDGQILLRLKSDKVEELKVSADCDGRAVVLVEDRATSDGTPYESKEETELWRGANGELIAYASWSIHTGVYCCVGEPPIRERRWYVFKRNKQNAF